MLELVYTHANLTEEEPATGRHTADVATEACRCLVNLLHHSDALAHRLHSKGMRPLLHALDREPSPAYRIAHLRLLFNCSLEKVQPIYQIMPTAHNSPACESSISPFTGIPGQGH